MLPAVAVREDDVVRSLAEVGVEREVLFEAARRGVWAKAACHPMDANTYKNLADWNGRIRHLSEVYAGKRWRRVEDHNVPFIVSSDGLVAITTARGNEDTGNPNRHPRTLFRKGAVALTVARQNRTALLSVQPDLGFFPYKGTLGPVALTSVPLDASIYYLLVDRRGSSLIAELSQPIRIDDANFAVEWRPRIILGSFPIGEPMPTQYDDTDDDDDSVDIPVTPRDGN